MATDNLIDTLIRSQLCRTSTFEPQGFSTFLAKAEPEDLREALKHAVPGTMFFLCKQVSDLSDSERKLKIVRVLADELTDEQAAGVKEIFSNMSRHYRDMFVTSSFSSDNLNSWTLAVELALAEEMEYVTYTAMILWRQNSDEHRALLLKLLIGFPKPRVIRFLKKQLKKETNPDIVLNILSASFQMKGHPFKRVYGYFLEHNNPEIRFVAVKGMVRNASWWCRRMLQSTLLEETDERIFGLIGRALLATPSDDLADLLFTAATRPSYPKINESASRLFRHLPDKLIRQQCEAHLNNPDNRCVAFAIQGVSVLDDPDIPTLLTDLASDTTRSGFVRSSAVEGLLQHKSKGTVAYLFNIVHHDATPPLVLYSALTTLTRLCDPEDINRILPLLNTSTNIRPIKRQAMLSFIQRKVRARKIILDMEITSTLSNIVLNGSDQISRYLALSILSIGAPAVDLKSYLEIVPTVDDPYLRDLLTKFIATRLQRASTLFLKWLLRSSRKERDVILGLNAICETQKDADADATIFVTLLCWRKGGESSIYKPLISKCLKYLIRNKDVALRISKGLPDTPAVMEGVLAFQNELTASKMRSVSHEALVRWVSANPASDITQRLVPTLAALKTNESQLCLLQLFRDRPELQEDIATALQTTLF